MRRCRCIAVADVVISVVIVGDVIVVGGAVVCGCVAVVFVIVCLVSLNLLWLL